MKEAASEARVAMNEGQKRIENTLWSDRATEMEAHSEDLQLLRAQPITQIRKAHQEQIEETHTEQ